MSNKLETVGMFTGILASILFVLLWITGALAGLAIPIFICVLLYRVIVHGHL